MNDNQGTAMFALTIIALVVWGYILGGTIVAAVFG